MPNRDVKRTEKISELSRLQAAKHEAERAAKELRSITQKYEKNYGKLTSMPDGGLRGRRKARPVTAAAVIASILLVVVLGLFGKGVMTGLFAFEPQSGPQFQLTGDVKVWNNTFDTTGKNISGVWQLYADAVADWFYPTSIGDRNFTLNTIPGRVELYWPENSTGITDRYTNFMWYNASNAENDALTYNIVVDDNSDFSSPVINMSNIAESGPTFSNYTSPVELELSKTYYWKVRAYDSKVYGEFSDVWQFNITPLQAITLIVANVSFGTMQPGDTNATDDNSPPPVLVENSGNIPVNLTFNGTELWTAVSAPNDYYLFKAGVHKPGSFNESASVMNWTQVPLTPAMPQIYTLKYIDTNDTVEIELNITAPPSEPGGAKQSDIVVSSSP